MNTKTTLIFVTLAAALAVVLAPSLVAPASAAIRDICEKNGRISEGIAKAILPKMVRMT
jgi:hypothetical protein